MSMVTAQKSPKPARGTFRSEIRICHSIPRRPAGALPESGWTRPLPSERLLRRARAVGCSPVILAGRWRLVGSFQGSHYDPVTEASSPCVRCKAEPEAPVSQRDYVDRSDESRGVEVRSQSVEQPIGHRAQRRPCSGPAGSRLTSTGLVGQFDPGVVGHPKSVEQIRHHHVVADSIGNSTNCSSLSTARNAVQVWSDS
jgi:hypothetical protein